MLELLAGGDRGVTELAAELNISQPSVSEQLATLRRVGLVNSTAQGRQRIYRIDTAPLQEVSEWVARLDVFWDERMARLGRLLTTLDREDQP